MRNNEKEVELTNDNIENDIYLYSMEDNKEVKIDMEDYIKGVVSAEMPALFNEEALKAQAVAARTYLVKHMSEKTNIKI